MARLYVWIENDRGQEVTLRGNERIAVQVNYGSGKDSKYVAELIVTWLKDTEKPTVNVHIASDLEREITSVV